MNLEEKHPDIQRYIKEMEKILEKNQSAILPEFRRAIQIKDMVDFYLWFSALNRQGKLPPEINEPLTNLYWSIR